MKIKLDENLPAALVGVLTAAGHNIDTAPNEGLAGRPDPDIWRAAQAAEFLNETEAGQKTILIFSDMQEELDYKTVRDFPIDLKGIRIIALNVTKLTTDNVDPRRYLGRLEWWEKRTRTAGAIDWRVVNDLEHLERVFKGRG